jgi:uncharacterized spore protein YtfJ
MTDNRVSEIIKSSLDGIKSFTDMENVIGAAINTPSGVTVIPVSKITLGFAGGGVDDRAEPLPYARRSAECIVRDDQGLAWHALYEGCEQGAGGGVSGARCADDYTVAGAVS